MMETLFLPLSYSFFRVALLTGAALAVVAALIGTHLTFKGFSMIGDGLSHVGFGAIAVAAGIGMAPLAVAIPVVIVAAFLLLRLSRRAGARADAAIALLSAASLAVGAIAVAKAGTASDLTSYLFGSVLAVRGETAPVILVLCGVLFLIYLLFYPAFFSITFDEDFFDAKTRRAGVFRSLLAALCAVVVVLGMQSVGALLISALLIFPASAASRLARSFRNTVLLAALFALTSFVTGLFLSYHLALPAGAAVVATNTLLYLLCLGISALLGRKE